MLKGHVILNKFWHTLSETLFLLTENVIEILCVQGEN